MNSEMREENSYNTRNVKTLALKMNMTSVFFPKYTCVKLHMITEGDTEISLFPNLRRSNRNPDRETTQQIFHEAGKIDKPKITCIHVEIRCNIKEKSSSW